MFKGFKKLLNKLFKNNKTSSKQYVKAEEFTGDVLTEEEINEAIREKEARSGQDETACSMESENTSSIESVITKENVKENMSGTFDIDMSEVKSKFSGIKALQQSSEDMEQAFIDSVFESINPLAFQYYKDTTIDRAGEVLDWLSFRYEDFPIGRFKSLNVIVILPNILKDANISDRALEKELAKGLKYLYMNSDLYLDYKLTVEIADRCSVVLNSISKKDWRVLERVQFVYCAVKKFSRKELLDICANYYGSLKGTLDWSRVDYKNDLV